MVAGVAPIDAVVAVGVDIHAEILIGLHQCFGILKSVLRMHIVVGQSVTEQQSAVQFAGSGYGAVIVARGVLLRRAHETLCID